MAAYCLLLCLFCCSFSFQPFVYMYIYGSRAHTPHNTSRFYWFTNCLCFSLCDASRVMSTFRVEKRDRLQPPPEVLRSILTRFTSDALVEKPEDILEYMMDWAQSHMKRSEDGATTVETGGLVRLTREMESMQALMNKRLRYYSNIADGCEYHYMMALEDSTDDIFQLQRLHHRVVQMKKTTQQVQKEQEEVQERLEYNLTHLETEDERSAKVHQIYLHVTKEWTDDMLLSPRRRIAMVEQEKSNN